MIGISVTGDIVITQHDQLLCRLHDQLGWRATLIDHLDEAISEITQEIASRLLPFEQQITLLTSITGVSLITAQVIIAETGGDMSRFPTSGHLCAWAGVAPAAMSRLARKDPLVPARDLRGYAGLSSKLAGLRHIPRTATIPSSIPA